MVLNLFKLSNRPTHCSCLHWIIYEVPLCRHFSLHYSKKASNGVSRGYALVLTRVAIFRKAKRPSITQPSSPSQRLKEILILTSSNYSLNTAPTAQRSHIRWSSMSMSSLRKCVLLVVYKWGHVINFMQSANIVIQTLFFSRSLIRWLTNSVESRMRVSFSSPYPFLRFLAGCETRKRLWG